MLRVTRIVDGGAAPTLKLEGKLVGPWVEELRAACAEPAGPRLDLAAVTFVDEPGTRLLHELLRRGATIAACSGFVAALLHVEKP